MTWIAATLRNNFVQAETYQREGLKVARRIGHREWMSILLLNLGETMVAQEKYTQALFYFEETLKLAQQISRPMLMVRTYYELGNIYLKQNHLEKAEEIFDKMMPMIPSGDQELQALAHYSLARLSAAQGNIQKARQLGEESMAAFEAMGHRETQQVRQWLDTIIAS